MVTAAQLIGKVAIEGADQSKTILLNMADNSQKLQDNFDKLQNAAKIVGNSLGSQLSNQIKNAQSSFQDLGSRAKDSGLNIDKFTTLQSKAAEAAAKLTTAETRAAEAQAKANTMISNGKASAEQIAVAQAKAAEAASKVGIAENAAGIAMQKVQTEAARLSEAMEQDSAETSLFSRALDSVKGALGSLGEKFQLASNEATEFGEKSQQSSGGLLSGFKNAAGGIVDFFGKAGLALNGAQMAWQTAIGVGKFLLGANADMEQVRVSFQAFIPDAKDLTATLADLKKFSAVTPFEAPEVNKAALALLNMKVQAKDLTSWIGNIGAAVSKVGGDGTALDEVTQIIQQMGVKGKVTTEEMLQLSERNIPAFQILADAMHVPVASLQDMISKGQLGKDKIELLVQSMGKFGGDAMVQQGKTFNGLLSTLKDNAEQALASFTSPLFDAAKQGLTVLGNLVSSPAFQNFATGAGQAIANAFGSIGGAVSRVIDGVKGFGNAVQSAGILGFVANFKHFGDELGGVVIIVERLGESIFQKLFTPLSQTSGITNGVAEAIRHLSDWFWNTGESLHHLEQFLGDIDVTPFTDSIKRIAGLLSGQFQQALKFIGDEAKQVGEWFNSTLAPAIKDAMPGFTALANAILNNALPAIIQIHGFLNELIEQRLKVFIDVMERIIPPVVRFAGILAGQVADGIKFITPYVVDAAKAITDFAIGIETRVEPIVNQWIQSLIPLVENFLKGWSMTWPTISGVLRGVWDEVVGIVKVAWALVSGVVKMGLDIMSGNWGQAWTDMKDMLKGVWDGIQTWVKGGIETMVGAFRPMLEAMANIPGPAGDMARKVLESFGGMKDGAQQKATDMKVKTLEQTAAMHTQAAQHLDQMRQDLINQMNNTSDPVQKKALEMKINTTAHMEEMHLNAAQSANKMKNDVVGHAKEMHDQSNNWFSDMLSSVKNFFGGIGKWFSDRFTEAKNGIASAFGSIGQWFQDRWHDIQNVFAGIGKWFGQKFAEIYAPIKPVVDYIGAVFETIGRIVHAIFDKIGAYFKGKWDEVTTATAGFVGMLGDKMHQAWDKVVGAFQFLGNWFHDRWVEVSNGLEWFKNIIGDKINQAWTKVTTTFAPIGGWFHDKWNEVVSGAEWLKNLIGSKISEAWTKVTTTFAPLGGWFHDQWQKVVDGAEWLKNVVMDKFNALKTGTANIFKGLINLIIDQLNNGISSVESFINFFGQGLDDIAKALGTKGTIPIAHLARIPHYATGTPASGHPGGPAIVGEKGPELAFLPAGTTVVPHDLTSMLLSMFGGKVPGYAGGIGDIVGSIAGWISGGAKSLLDNVVNTLHIQAPNLGPMTNLATGIFDKVKDWALSWVDSILPKFSFGAQNINVPGNLASWIASAMGLTGVPASWANPLAQIALHESGGNPGAINLWDINAIQGHPSQGLFQTIPSTFAAYAVKGHGNILNPIDNAAAAINYIKSRYGDVFHVPGILAMSHGGAYVGYSEGGPILEPIIGKGLRTGTNYAFGEKGPETVIPGPYVPSGVNLAQMAPTINITNVINVQPNDFNIDGRRMNRALEPYRVEEARRITGANI